MLLKRFINDAARRKVPHGTMTCGSRACTICRMVKHSGIHLQLACKCSEEKLPRATNGARVLLCRQYMPYFDTNIVLECIQTKVFKNMIQACPLLAHKYEPESIDSLKCHRWQAQRLREWIQEFTSASRNRSHDTKPRRSNGIRSTDYDDSSSMSDASDTPEVARKCVLLTGPPGVGKTSLVYCVARELKMHVVESHASEKRDFRLFSTLKLANQKGKINPIARLFQVAQKKQTCQISEDQEQRQQRHSKRKRRKLDEPDASDNQSKVACNGNSKVANNINNNNNQQLSLSGDSSIVLFDDIDVVFEEDGPFLKSLIEFIGESKRPVILTATQSIDYLKDILVHFEHIHLDRPALEECVQLLQEVCTREGYYKLATVTNCKILARKSNGDLRQCLNRIQFYGEEQASSEIQDDVSDIPNVTPDLSRLSGHLVTRSEDEDVMRSSQKTIITDEEATIIYNGIGGPDCSDPLGCYDASSYIDLMDSALNIVDRPTLLKHWLDGVPSYRNAEPTSGHDLGEQIRQSIVETTHKLFCNDILGKGELQKHKRDFDSSRSRAREMGQRINLRIKSRIEPPERDFYIDIVPMLGETIKLEAGRKRECALSRNGKGCYSPTTTTTTTIMTNGFGDRPRSPVTGSGTILSRRTRRVQSYLDLIGVYLEQEEFLMVEDTLLTTGPDDCINNQLPTTTKDELPLE